MRNTSIAAVYLMLQIFQSIIFLLVSSLKKKEKKLLNTFVMSILKILLSRYLSELLTVYKEDKFIKLF